MKIFKSLIIITFTIFLGIYVGTFLYSNYLYNKEDKLNSYKIYLLETGPFDNYDSLEENNKILDSYFYFKDIKGYHSILAITENENNLNKLGELYKDIENINIREELTTNMEFIESLRQYDKIILDGDNTEIINGMKQITSKYGELILNNEENIN